MGRRLKIVLVSQAEVAAYKANDPDLAAEAELWGWFDPINGSIHIWSGLEEAAFKRVLLHEITHALFALSGLTHMMDDKLEEAVCDVSEHLVDLFSNQKFVESYFK